MGWESHNHCGQQSRDDEEEVESGTFLKSGSGKSLSGSENKGSEKRENGNARCCSAVLRANNVRRFH